MTDRMKSHLRQLCILALLFLLALLPVILLTHADAASPAAPLRYPAPSVTLPGIYAPGDWFNVLDPNLYPVAGNLWIFTWGQLNPHPDVYDWDDIENWVNQVVSTGKRAAIGISTYNGRCCGGIDQGMPWWARDAATQFNVADYVGGPDWYIPRYWDPVYKYRYKAFIQALGERYRNDPRIEFVAIGLGTFGELHATDDYGQDRDAIAAAGLTRSLWISTVEEFIDAYVDAFSENGELRKPLLAQIASFTFSPSERRDVGDYAAARDVGLSNNILYPDGNSMVIGDNTNCPYCGKYDHILRHNEEVPIAFETYDYVLCNPTHLYWALLSGLDKRVDYFRLDRTLFVDEDNNPRSENLPLITWASRYVGKTAADTPSAWVAMREHRTPWVSCRGTETVSWYPQLGNYDFFLEQDDSVPGGRTVPETNDPDITGESAGLGWCPNPPEGVRCNPNAYNPIIPPGKEGWVTRRTDVATGNPYMFFKLDDAYLFGATSYVTITVTYADVGSDRWRLGYRDASGTVSYATPQGSTTDYVQKTDSNTWRQAVFVLTDAVFDNSLAGNSDFFLDALDGDEWVHMVDVARGAGTPPTATPTPTAMPTWTGTPPTATPTPTPTPTWTPSPTPVAGSWRLQWWGGGEIRGLSFVDASYGWGVGTNGTIIATTDGGVRWHYDAPFPDFSLEDVLFWDRSSGWAVGSNGIILHTTDGGITWAVQGSGTTQTLRAVAFNGPGFGYVVGDGGTVLFTTDGGQTWTAQDSGTTANLRGLYVNSVGQAWAVGDGGTIITNTDGPWTVQFSGVTATLYDVAFTSSSFGWVVGEAGTMRRTTNGGQTWFATDTTVSADLYALAFASDGTGFAVGSNGTILRSTSGDSWEPVSVGGEQRHFYAVAAVDSTHAWAGGVNEGREVSNGEYDIRELVWTVWHTDDGVTWELQAGDKYPRVRGIDFVDTERGWAALGDGVILDTTDGGYSWRWRQILVDQQFVWDIDFVDRNTGWAAARWGTILKSTDGGETWFQQSSNGYGGWIYAVEAWDTQRVWMGTTGWIEYNQGMLWTHDGGTRWNHTHVGANLVPWDISFINGNEGWVAMEGDSWSHTTDGGQTWQRGFTQLWGWDDTPGWMGVEFVDSQTGWLVGYGGSTTQPGRIVHTTNGGASWTAQVDGGVSRLEAIQMLDRQQGWVVGYEGTILATTDGGGTWVQQDSDTTADLEALIFVDVNHGWASGEHGAILAYGGTNALPPAPTPTATSTPSPTSTLSPTKAAETPTNTPTPTATPSPDPNVTPTPVTVVVAVAASTDDTSVKVEDNENRVDWANVRMGSTGSTYFAGFRFANVDIPPHAQIQKARLDLTYVWGSGAPIDLVISGEATGDASDFSTDNDRADLRPRVGISVTWHLPTQPETFFSSPDIAPVVQQIVNRPDWAAGHALNIFVANGDGNSHYIDVYAFDAPNGLGPTYRAQLTVTYLPPNCRPGDVNCDGQVTVEDLALAAAHWGEQNPILDQDSDGDVDIVDLQRIAAAWQASQ
ncbi:MAG TPA: hypothetical protein EYH31_06550 [Anaerolineae bacterium]|nr:hypothetical protein [Anaerolineae bacterium]